MLQMFRSRGTAARDNSNVSPSLSQSSSSSGGASANTRNSPSTSIAAGPARPLRLVYLDAKGKFVMDPEAVATLQLVKGPVGVVSVCGRARQGKSFILNQLLGRSNGFQVASTHKPCTKGLWMWSAPLKRTAIDGTEYNLVLLDSEGIDAYDQTGTYSTQIFSLALLLSSMFIYNQMGPIDETALDRLSLVTEMTKHIRVRASGGRASVTELGHFSPIFVWLLRVSRSTRFLRDSAKEDFYLSLAEDDGRRITPRDYLELALRSVQGGQELVAKNEIRESIRALFPDRECFTLVRPLADENALQKLDQIPLDKLRPEFRSGLDALTKFVFERTRPKQVGATIMTGPLFVGITQSFLDAINSGAVPTISSSWQSVEEAECRRAYELAAEVYMSSFDRSKPPEEALLRASHEDATKKSLAAFGSSAVGVGLTRQKYENQLHDFLRKAFEDYKRTAFMEADLRCSNAIQDMDKRLRESCHVPNAQLKNVLEVLDGLLSEYEISSHGPGKWQKLARFLQQSLEGPIFDLIKKQQDKLLSEKNDLILRNRANEDKLGLLGKQLEANEQHRSDYLRRYEEAISDKRKMAEDYLGRINNLQCKYSSLEERYSNLSKTLDATSQESAEWKRKYEHLSSRSKAEEEQVNAERAALKSRATTAEARLAAAREQVQSAQEEASEWKRKFDIAVKESKSSLEKAAQLQDRIHQQAQLRERSLRTELSASLAKKDEEIKAMATKIEQVEHHAMNLSAQLKVAETTIKNSDAGHSNLKIQIEELQGMLGSAKASAQSYEREARILEQEKSHLEERYLTEFKRFEEVEDRCRTAEKEAKRAIELADNARTEAASAQKEKSEIHRVAIERLAHIERAERHIESLERQKLDLMEEAERLRVLEMEAVSKVSLLEGRVDAREKEIEELVQSSNEQRTTTVKVLESLLATERAAHAEANNRAEGLSLQLQATQGKLDSIQQQLTSARLNEAALDGKLKTVSHSKRSRFDDYTGVDSVHDMETDAGTRVKRSKSTTSPIYFQSEDGGSVFRPNGDESPCDSEDYAKFTVQKLKQELTKHGFGAQLLQLRNPNKKDILSLYEKHVLKQGNEASM